ncbi:tRNA sulfurtransferase [Moraxella ovis]|nr:tRNA sulfurtransferase [Moraxella ovis]STZ06833.1 tRNA sulfurtransferase [Moraxella ovis]
MFVSKKVYNKHLFYLLIKIMKFIVKVFPEIIMKSESIKKRFIKVLWGNIQNVLMQHDKTVKVIRHWNFLEVRSR